MGRVPKSEELELASGLHIGLSKFGSDSFNEVAFYFHGFPGSRKEAVIFDKAGKKKDVTIIALDRPGFGLSDYQPGRTILDWPAIVEEVADTLKLDRFHVIGVSGGTPYSLVCSAKIPERIKHTFAISGLGPLEDTGLRKSLAFPYPILGRIGAGKPRIGSAFGISLAFLWKHCPELMFKSFRLLLSESDRELLDRPDLNNLFHNNFVEALRKGAGGLGHEMALLNAAWEFDLGDISKKVFILHGTEDLYVAPQMSLFLNEQLANSELILIPEAGHFMVISIADDILDIITENNQASIGATAVS